ncbi:TasA family protein [Bacillus sp. 1P06AnD]|uniref:TasA family protein n=1 Tax=Bacillus sp. 1P06AnD TaxID=3132208 RepID=UPI0039A3A3EA
MNVKAKLMTGALSAVVGIALVGGGTWAAFNDTEQVAAKVEAGKLDLLLLNDKGTKLDKLFEISNMKPGDYMERTFTLKNNGTLAIKDVLMSINFSDFKDYVSPSGDTDVYGENTALDFLDQLELSVVTVGAEGGSGGFPKAIIQEGSHITLADVYKATNLSYTGGDAAAARSKIAAAVNPSAYWVADQNRLNVATLNPNEWTGLPVKPYDPDNVKIKITFKDDKEKTADGKLYVQNKYNGDSIGVTFEFEARQWQGLDVQPSDQDANGYIKSNEKANNGK